jgi:hypothetical protein
VYKPPEATVIQPHCPSALASHTLPSVELEFIASGSKRLVSVDPMTKMHAKFEILLSSPDATSDFVDVLVPDTLEHHVNVSDTSAIPSTLEYGNRTYKIIRGNMTWYAAGKSCRMHRAELASIPDAFHQAFLTVLLSRLGHTHWIGLSTTDVGVLSPSLLSTSLVKQR